MWAEVFKKLMAVIITKEVIAATKDKAQEVYNDVKNWWTGKCIAIIGPTASGKNSMFSRLKKESIPSEHFQTRGSEKVDVFKFYWPLPDKSKVEFRCKGSINTGGEVDERDRYWLQACKDADVIFYLVDMEKISESSGDTMKRIEDDFQWIASNFQNFKSNSIIHIMLNKVDVLLSGVSVSEDILSMTHIADEINKIEKIAREILHVFFDKRVSGVTPISMANDYYFSKYFTITLKQISESWSS